ncbi:5-oxoprolinase subunit PxpB [Sporomusa termitida]|uniref:Kinase A inhibitor n=1 Tax=Sporomusa termitida TaxID=2377 RepID=A0A517DYB8_9FIRM|nr:5-oxoprolinase subunit PxpB [Sporomusa termitida]QDR82347.1 Kinase A inhibitor [Sporomusa termitida]
MKVFPEAVKLQLAGEYGLVVEFGTVISPAINALVLQLTSLLLDLNQGGIREVVPTYRSVSIYFDPLILSRQDLTELVETLLARLNPVTMLSLPARIVNVPVCYGGVLGPDLDFVARYTGLSVREVITAHTGQPYLVYMLGFTPGFPYLGGLPAQLEVPRQETPRNKVPAGSVGIGGNQTGFYPIESTGEWWLIGRTPLKAFAPQRSKPFLVAAGDYVQFTSIGIDDYFAIRRAVAAGVYQLETIIADKRCEQI